MAACSRCSADNPDGQRFCGQCGTPLSATCRACGAPYVAGQRFCGECGHRLADAAPADTGGAPNEPDLPLAERRLCTVLFVDLVGFTPLSESRDPEEVRELLSAYFANARTIVDRYGGTVEKFIGDAVMAVWGTPRALEGDTERAVRAALDMVSAVAELGERLGAPGLRARAGVVTGEVAVNLDAVGEGMVAGDAVNTAARVQTAAEPGVVLVDGATQRLAAPAIEFAGPRPYTLKGKAEPEELWEARHVASGVGGSQRVDGLEAPFVGRELEFRLVKDLLHATSQRREPRLVVVSGAAGVGKSRLGWEFEKYVDGLAEGMFWHRGRCLPFGEDVAFWALTEIVRGRIGAAEDDPPDVVAAKLDVRLQELFDDPAERAYVGARLARLLSLPSASTAELAQEELFAGWRRFFEQLAELEPVLLLIEDAQYADPGLLDFVEHLVDWSRDIALMVLLFTRPEIESRRPGLGIGRHRTLLALEPLAPGPMRQLLEGLVPRLPDAAADAISAQAEGIPLFAVETVRSLIDQDVVLPRDGVYTLVTDVGDLAVPDSLHTLLAARIDALDPVARSVVADAAVLGSNFVLETLLDVSGTAPEQVEESLRELVRRDVLQVSADQLSPQLGSYSFTHGLLAQVAYSTLSRRDLKVRHRRVAEHLQQSARNEGDALAEVIARHYLDALRARPDDDDTAELRGLAIDWLRKAGERSSRSGGQVSAARLFAAAAEIAEEAGTDAADLTAADLWFEAAQATMAAADGDTTVSHAERAVALYGTAGRPRLAALAMSLVGRGHQQAGRSNDARPFLVEAVAILEEEPDAHTVAAMCNLAGVEAMLADPMRERSSDKALRLGQDVGVDPIQMAELLVIRGLVHTTLDRIVQAEAYFREAWRMAEDAGSSVGVARALGNLSDITLSSDPAAALGYAEEAARHARLIGARWYLVNSSANAVLAALATGAWADARARIEVMLGADGLDDIPAVRQLGAIVQVLHGDVAGSRADFDATAELTDRDEPQDLAFALLAECMVAYAEGDLDRVLEISPDLVRLGESIGMRSDPIRWGWPVVARAAYDAGDVAASQDLLAVLDRHPRGHLAPVLAASATLARGRLATDPADRVGLLAAAIEELRAVGSPYHLAEGLLDAAEAFEAVGRDDAEALRAEAAGIAESIGARLLLQRARLGETVPPDQMATARRPEAERTSP